MSAQDCITALDRALAAAGQDITLRRVAGTETQTNTDVTCRATIRDYAAHELVGGIMQGDRQMILSPTEINAAAWPLPVRVSDKVVISDKIFTVLAVNALSMAGTLVRIELQVRG